MADRYTELSRIEENLYLEGSPIIIEAGALLKDNSDESVLCHFRLKNAYSSTLLYCKIGIKEIRVDGTVNNDILEHFYVDLKTSAGGTFGEGKIIKLTDYLTRQVEVCVIEAKYENGLIWTSPFCNWIPLPQRESLKSRMSDYSVVQQYEIEVGGNATYIPKTVNGAFFCTCGEISCILTCNKCGRKYDDLIEKLDGESLKVKVNERLEKEEKDKKEKERIRKINEALDKQRIENERAERQELRNKRRKARNEVLILCSAIISVLLICFAIYYFFSPLTLPFLCRHKIVEATCEADGYCSRCGTIYSFAIGHKWDNGRVVKAQTCIEDGLRIFKCQNDSSHVYSEAIPASHIWKAATCTEPKTCIKCNIAEGKAKGHTLSLATCTEPSKCFVCGNVGAEALGHEKVGYACSRCGISMISADDLDSIIEITKLSSTYSYLTVDTYFTIANKSPDKTIKSMYINLKFYDDEGNVLLKSDGDELVECNIYETIQPGEIKECKPCTSIFYTFNHIAHLEEITIRYTDGTELTLDKKLSNLTVSQWKK